MIIREADRAARNPTRPRERTAAMTDTKIHDDRAAGRLEARTEGGDLAGHIAYFVLEEPGRALVPVHTVVRPEFEGQGIAGSLARELYGIAAREGLPVAPLCPYVVKWAARHPEEAPAAHPELLKAAKRHVAAHPEQW
ncbi:GNAT family N-acetyltransferase [Streptomyces sp. LE64]|uniref:GNAT family N-acetyltransferase n=1 Tax=Streptomyces sp. LE64 TaxID=3448653 RepID=UPI0040438825